jgi:hypothetical protein
MLTNSGGVVIRKAKAERFRVSRSISIDNIIFGCIGRCESNVFSDCAINQQNILADHAKTTLPIIKIFQIHAIHPNNTTRSLSPIEPQRASWVVERQRPAERLPLPSQLGVVMKGQ